MYRSARQLAAAVAVAAAVVAAVAATPAAAVTLYDGDYATDISTSAPGGLSPSSGSTSAYPSPFTLGWRSVPGASTYQIQVARQSSSSASCTSANAFQADNLVVTTTTSQTSWVPSLTSASTGSDVWLGTYCWRVRTHGSPAGSWSSGSKLTRTWTSTPSNLLFYNDTDGPIPRTTSSSDYGTGSTTTKNSGYFDWNPVAGAATYEIQVASSQSFSPGSVMISRNGIVGTRMVSLHLPDDTYYWRVRAVAPNGTEGGWSTGTHQFTQEWDDPDWSTPSKLYPADSSGQPDALIGWTPVPGAAWYEYQVGTNGGCFWNSATPSSAPAPWGDWQRYGATYDDTGTILQYTGTHLSSQCRLSRVGATTINNFVSVDSMVDPEVWEYMANDCLDDEGKVECGPVAFPHSDGVDLPAATWRGAMMAANAEDQAPASLSWRVRPVFRITQESETNWKVGQSGVTVYGSWTRYTSGGENRAFKFDVDPSTITVGSAGTRCVSGLNPGSTCLAHVGESMQADEAFGAATSTTMQVPAFSWEPFTGATGYIVQIARDPLFNNTVSSTTIDIAYARSYVPTGGMVDNSQGSGYWWRVIPCMRELPYPGAPYTQCSPLYSEDAGDLPTNYSDGAVAQTFVKRAELQTKVSAKFNGAAPLISWADSSVSASDYEGWARGISGADRYELQLARDPFMTEDLVTILTTSPRAVPYAAGSSAGETTELGDGIWYYRVRAIDKGTTGGAVDSGDIEGGWSAVASFNKRVLAPDPSVSGGGAGSSAPGVTVSWDSVEGATSYTIQWSTTTTFASASSATTRQTSYRIPSTTLGTFYWRVRARVGSVDGLWSTVTNDGPKVTITAPTKIRFALNKSLINAKDYAMLDAQLLVAGQARSGKRIQLQAKNRNCGSSVGRYAQVAQAVTGRNVDDGMVRFRIHALSNACLRLAWVGDGSVHYSAPIEVRTQPVISFAPSTRSVLRAHGFCGQVRSNVKLNGRVRVQYRVGSTWNTARTSSVSGRSSFRQCAAINRSGTFPMRIVVDQLTHPTQGWRIYEPTARAAGSIRVNDAWTVS